MTREEELNKASIEYRKSREECGVKDPILLDEVEEAFYVAGEWADKTMLEKAIKWIETNIDDYIHVEYDTVTGKPTNEAHIAHKKVIDDFKKAMEDVK